MNNSAVFFLGNKAHYQALETPSTSSIKDTNANIQYDYFNNESGVNLRRRTVNSPFTNDRSSDECDDVIDSINGNTDKEIKRELISKKWRLSSLLNALRFDRTKDFYINTVYCTYKDLCPCLECQCRYFECDESMSEGSCSDSEETQPDESECEDNVDLMSTSVSGPPGQDDMKLEMVAGTPVILDFLLHNPIVCSIQ